MPEFSARDRWQFVARAGVSLLFGIPALYVVLKGQPAESVKWATGVIGLIMGYWLR